MAELSAADMGAILGNRMGAYGTGAGAWGLGAGLLGGLFFGSLINGNGWFGNRGGDYATQEQVQGMFNYSNLLDQNRDLATAISNSAAQGVAATNQIFHDLVGYVGDKYSELDRDVLAIGGSVQQSIANQNQCCCNTLRAIDGVNYNSAINTASIKSEIAAGFSGIKEQMAQNKMDAMQNQIDGLRLQLATGNTVKYPTTASYSIPVPPVFGPTPTPCGFGF